MTTQRRYALRRNVVALIIGALLSALAVANADEAPRRTGPARYAWDGGNGAMPTRIVLRRCGEGAEDTLGKLILVDLRPGVAVYRCRPASSY